MQSGGASSAGKAGNVETNTNKVTVVIIMFVVVTAVLFLASIGGGFSEFFMIFGCDTNFND